VIFLQQARVHILGVPFDQVTLKVAVERIATFLDSTAAHQVVTANPEGVMLAQQDKDLAQAVKAADLVVADGIGVVWAAQKLGQPLPERVPGIELTQRLLQLAAEKGYGVYILGGAPGVAEEAAAKLAAQFPGLNIVGFHHGYFDEQAGVKIEQDIKAAAPHLLLVGLGMPKQEIWIHRRGKKLGVPVAIGVGGSLDVFAGRVKRAPSWMCKLGLEWFYRLVTQPQRAVRMLALPRFAWQVWRSKH
jgi:N-acetylglucosaminyldiphosphoundecaprenol N-acetyl-beta-D-mannosaminyltransferase